MGGAGDGILIEAEARVEAAGDDVGLAMRACGGDDNAANILGAGEGGDLFEVRLEIADGGLVLQFDKVVHAVASDEDGLGAEHGGEVWRGCSRLGGLGGKVELDPGLAIEIQPVRIAGPR